MVGLPSSTTNRCSFLFVGSSRLPRYKLFDEKQKHTGVMINCSRTVVRSSVVSIIELTPSSSVDMHEPLIHETHALISMVAL